MTDLKKLAEVKRYEPELKYIGSGEYVPTMLTAEGGDWVYYNETADIIRALQQEVETLRSERDLAVAHDRQPYPTADAYEAACTALHKCKERIANARQEALALAENICRAHAREYGAINESVTNEHRRLDYASERALLTAADAISALQQPTVEDGETKP